MLKNLNDEQKINVAFIGSLIKGFAHNINTPLSAIIGRSEMLQMRLNRIMDKKGLDIDVDELDKCLKDISLIIESSSRVTETIKNIMQKIINAESDKPRYINISNLLKDELEFLDADMDFKHNIEKSFNLDDNIPSINGIYVQLSNSFLEILENSIQSMLETEEKKLIVSASYSNSYIEVKFHDTGKGIEPEERERLLQILNDSVSAYPGAESGIVRVARLLKSYNARFDIQSRPGDTTFCIKFPITKRQTATET